jgi:hypothetical protein
VNPATPAPRPSESYSDSSDSLIVEVTGPGDTTVRPLTGNALTRARAEWEIIQSCMRQREERERAEKEKADREHGDLPPPEPAR